MRSLVMITSVGTLAIAASLVSNNALAVGVCGAVIQFARAEGRQRCRRLDTGLAQ